MGGRSEWRKFSQSQGTGGRAEWGHPRMEGGWGIEQGCPQSRSAPWERCTQKPFEVGDLGVAHPQLGHCLRQCSLLSWDKKSLLLFQNTPCPPFLPSSLGFPSLLRTGSALGFPLFLPPWPLPPLGVEKERSDFGGTAESREYNRS